MFLEKWVGAYLRRSPVLALRPPSTQDAGSCTTTTTKLPTPPLVMWPLVVVVLLVLQASAARERGPRCKLTSVCHKSLMLPVLFNILRFNNDVCEAGGGDEGVCYTGEECTNKVLSGQTLLTTPN